MMYETKHLYPCFIAEYNMSTISEAYKLSHECASFRLIYFGFASCNKQVQNQSQKENLAVLGQNLLLIISLCILVNWNISMWFISISYHVDRF